MRRLRHADSAEVVPGRPGHRHRDRDRDLCRCAYDPAGLTSLLPLSRQPPERPSPALAGQRRGLASANKPNGCPAGSAPTPPRPTYRGSSPNSAPATASSSSSWPLKRESRTRSTSCPGATDLFERGPDLPAENTRRNSPRHAAGQRRSGGHNENSRRERTRDRDQTAGMPNAGRAKF